MKIPDLVLIFTTAPAGAVAESIARTLVDERLAACVNVGSPMTSFYRWQGQVTRDVECQLVIKTTGERLSAARSRVAALHPYDLPEWVVVTAAEVGAGYLDWVRSATAAPDGEGTR